MNLLHPEKEVVITAAKRTLAIVFVCFINPTFILLSLPFRVEFYSADLALLL